MLRGAIFIAIAWICFGVDTYARTGATLAFIENKNQWNHAVRYKADLPGGAVFLTDAGFTYSFYDVGNGGKTNESKDNKAGVPDTANGIVRWHAYRINFLGANTHGVNYVTQDKREEYYNFFLGNNPDNWAGKVPAYDVVTQHHIYDGIDMKLYSNAAAMKYDFIVSPGADPAQIVLNFEGVRPELTPDGDLKIKTSVNEIVEGKPVSYQVINGRQKEIKSAYRQLGNGDITFVFPDGYDTEHILVIDPSLVFSTYGGSVSQSSCYTSTYDQNGALFVCGPVLGTDFPATVGAFEENFTGTPGPFNLVTNAPSGPSDLGIEKFSPDGTSLIYATYYGGSLSEGGIDMGTTSANELVVFGFTLSSDLPVSDGCYDSTLAGGIDYYVARFSEDGSALIGATYLGGSSDEAFDWATSEVGIDRSDNIVIVGNTHSLDYPVTANAAQPSNAKPPTIPAYKDGVVSKLSPDCSQLLYSTYLGGSILDACLGVTFNDLGDIIVCGQTNSRNFPTTPNVLHPNYQGGDMNGFLTVIDGTTGAIKASTYIAGEGYLTADFRPRRVLYDIARKVQMDENQNIVVEGNTWGGYPISPGVFSVAGADCFLDRISPDLSVSVQATRLGVNTVPSGGGSFWNVLAFRYSACGNNYTYLAGSGIRPGMAVTPDAHTAAILPDEVGYYFCVLDANWQNLVYGSYFPAPVSYLDDGTSHFDDNGTLYQYSITSSQNFPVTPGVFAPGYSQSQFLNGSEMAAFKFEFVFPESNVPSIALNDTLLCNQDVFTFTPPVSNTIPQTTYEWSPAAAVTPPSGSQTVTIGPALSTDPVLVVKNGVCGSASDTMHIRFSTVMNAAIHPADTSICPGDTILLTASGGTDYAWDVADNMVTNSNTAIVWPVNNTTYAVIVSDTNNCRRKVTATANMLPLPEVNAGSDIYLAHGTSTRLDGNASGSFIWKGNVTNPYILQPEINPRTTTTYTLVATSAKGCIATDSVTVYIVGTGFPNAFSPNGDGLNDVFIPVVSNKKGYIPLDFSIYNRWGERIFYSLDSKSGWDGTYNNKAADAGSYYYYIKYQIGDREFIKKGDVTLIR